MKKLIALTASAVLASSAAIADVAITGAASVSYDDNGSSASATTYDADLTFTASVGTVGGSITTLTVGMDVDASAAITIGIILVYGLVFWVWLNYANHSYNWVPYTSILPMFNWIPYSIPAF